MNVTKKTYYGMGIVAAALTGLGGVLLILGSYAALLYNIATLLTGGMMLFMAAASRGQGKHAQMYTIGLVLLLAGLVPGVIGKICGALAWPAFALPYFNETEKENPLHTIAYTVLLCGAVQLVGSFLPLSRMIAACISIAIAVAQGLLVWLLFQAE